jgi:hypothetical protein
MKLLDGEISEGDLVEATAGPEEGIIIRRSSKKCGKAELEEAPS